MTAAMDAVILRELNAGNVGESGALTLKAIANAAEEATGSPEGRVRLDEMTVPEGMGRMRLIFTLRDLIADGLVDEEGDEPEGRVYRITAI